VLEAKAAEVAGEMQGHEAKRLDLESKKTELGVESAKLFLQRTAKEVEVGREAPVSLLRAKQSLLDAESELAFIRIEADVAAGKMGEKASELARRDLRLRQVTGRLASLDAILDLTRKSAKLGLSEKEEVEAVEDELAAAREELEQIKQGQE
jgi:outer membrane protein TolC